MQNRMCLKHWFCCLLVCCAPWVVLAEGLVISDGLLQKVEAQYGGEARRRVIGWRDLMASGATESDREKLERVNDFFNRMRFVDDSVHWGKEDYWATPVEFLASNGGDCEDFSLAKYFTLKELGVPVDRMRLTYAKAVKLDQAHMVLTYFEKPSAEPLVLDNLVSDIRPASRRKDLVPVYSFKCRFYTPPASAGFFISIGNSYTAEALEGIMSRNSLARSRCILHCSRR